MEFHIKCEAKDVSKYVFCPGDQARAKLIADHFKDSKLVSDARGIHVYSGAYKGVFMTACGTGMGGPVVAIALEELANMGADTFIRVGSCGVFQDDQQPGDIIIASGTFRAGGTANAYLPLAFPAVPTFEITQKIVASAEKLGVPFRVGVGVAGDAFYAPRDPNSRNVFKNAGVVSVEMESDTLFIVGAFRGWRTGALYASDGTNTEVKPEWGEELYKKGQADMIRVALEAMLSIANED
ncbi:MAG: nucleoside phosphorylase [Anaerolineaceae bacterium]|nr:nucleoside phosphorylase [Anaerolineaceae bacterium]